MSDVQHGSSAHGEKGGLILKLVGLVAVFGSLAGTALGFVVLQRDYGSLYSGEEQTWGAQASSQINATAVGDPERGHRVFNLTCYACHGPTGLGVPNLGAPLRTSKFVASHNDKQLVSFIKAGRLPTDKDSLFHLTMPPRGANPGLDEGDLLDVVSFIRTLQDPAVIAQAGGAVK